MKKIYSFLICTAFAVSSFAQTTILNPSFETWGGSGKQEEPINWNSNQTGTGQAASAFAPQTCFKETTNPHTGTYCARVQSGNAFGIVVNGSLTTGRIEAPSTNKAEGYVSSLPYDPDFRMSFIGRPDSVVFWYRYTPSGTDYFSVSAFLHVDSAFSPETPVNNNHRDKSANVIARSNYTSSTAAVATWTRVSMPLTYVDNRTPQYIFIACTSSGNQTGGVSGTKLYLDDFEAIYNPKITTNAVSPLTYYVTATAGSTINVPFSIAGTFQAGNVVTAELSNATGSFASPIVLGTTTTTASGTVAGTIPGGTAAGTAYRVRTKTTTPALTGNDNGANISIIVVSNSIAPTATQTIAANTNGTTLNVTETAGASSRVWKYSTTAGGPYSNFSPNATGTSLVPKFATGGTYYVVCETTYPGGVTIRSNEVMFNVVGNSIAPTATQSIAINSNGNVLTVTETATASSRQWKYASISGGPYSAFAPAKTATTYTPNFATAGTYFVVCESVIGSLTVTSNEVEITVTSPFLTTGNIAGSPFEFSPSAPSKSVTVPFTVTGSVFVAGNVFTAQLSDATGSFATPTAIGSTTGTTSGTISASIPNTTPAGLNYRIRVVGSNQATNGSNNGTDLVVDQFNNSVSPSTTQSIVYNTNGTAITVSASQTALHEWKFSQTSGSGYASFAPPKTGATFTPNFAVPGTYYVVACSKNQYLDEVCSSEVRIDVLNGSTLSTSTVSGSPYLVSPKANVAVSVPFTSNIIFGAGNTFTAELSDMNGSFTTPVAIGTRAGTNIAPVSATIPNNTFAGTKYRVRVTSSNPATVGTDNGADLTVIPFELSVLPLDTQFLFLNVAGDTVTASETQPATREWLFSQFSGFSYQSFSPKATDIKFAPKLPNLGTYYMICRSVNAVMDTVLSSEIVLIVKRDTTGISTTGVSTTKVYAANRRLYVERENTQAETLTIYNLQGQKVLETILEGSKSKIELSSFSAGVYVFELGTEKGKIAIN